MFKLGTQGVVMSIGSCVQAGHTTCCDNSTCEGSPANCYCDANCHLFQDCCIDVPAECSQQGKVNSDVL